VGIGGRKGHMKLRAAAAAGVVLVAAAAHATLASAAVSPTPATSSNWAGYVLSAPAPDPTSGVAQQPLTFTNVTGTWVEPKARCTSGSRASAAFWVGLGGSSETSAGLEQIGTSVDCNGNGSAVHSAWYELIPAPAVPIKMKIAAGDTITTAVVANGTTVTLQITNRTRHTRFTKTVSVPSPDLTSAEWIAEAPSLCATSGRCRVVPLANFGAVRFTSAAATANAHPGVITDDTWTALPVQLQAGDGRPFGGFFGSTGGALTGNALPGVVSADGRAFSVAWQASSG
jgi:hypothetical protein